MDASFLSWVNMYYYLQFYRIRFFFVPLLTKSVKKANYVRSDDGTSLSYISNGLEKGHCSLLTLAHTVLTSNLPGNKYISCYSFIHINCIHLF